MKYEIQSISEIETYRFKIEQADIGLDKTIS